MEIAKIMDELDEIIDGVAYVRGSFVGALVGGDIGKEGLSNWAVQKYHQVFQQNRAFAGIHYNSPYEDVRQFQMEQLIAEETGICDGSEAHYALMARFARALNADPAETEMAPEVAAFIDYLLGICGREHFVFGLLAFYVNERQTPAAVTKMETHLRDVMGFTDHDLEWFTLHGELDDEHSSKGRELILKYADEAPGFADRAPEIVRNGCEQWNRLQDYYYRLAIA
jgi:pyrroloquinoline-quinone synthase